MNINLSKLCADFLRQNYAFQSTENLKASHARELVAAFFGYKSHAALIAEKTYPLIQLEEVPIFIPDIPLINDRHSKLTGLPNDLTMSEDLAKLLLDMLVDKGLYSGKVCLNASLETFVEEVILPENQSFIDDELSPMMAETNAIFYDAPDYYDVKIEDRGDILLAIAKGKYKGKQLDDKPFCGDTLDISVHVTFRRMAGKRGFDDSEVEVGARVNNNWIDDELLYELD